MKAATKIISCAAAVALSYLTACSVSDADDEIYLAIDKTTTNSSSSNGSNSSGKVDGDDFVPVTLADSELVYNHKFLDVYYLNHGELGSIDDYYGMASGSQYADVYYMYSKMSDPMTNYYDPYYADYVMNQLYYSETNVGIGAEAKFYKKGEKDSVLVFSQIYSKGPAEKAGLLKGDTILTVRGVKPTNMDAYNTLASGSAGKTIDITVKRDVEKSITVTLNTYQTPTVFLDSIDNIPVIRITDFAEITPSDSGSYGEFIAALNKTKGAKSTIIDLRGNGGGLIYQCLGIASELLNKGDTIITIHEASYDSITDSQRLDTLTYEATTQGLAADRYLVFLADSNSASCSEYMLSSITINKKSPVVGHLSYGKGCGQLYSYTYAGGVATVTSMMVYDKNGKTFHKVGIEPDYAIDDEDAATAKAVELAKSTTATREKGYGTKDQGRFNPKSTSSTSKSASLNKKAASMPDLGYGQAAVIKEIKF